MEIITSFLDPTEAQLAAGYLRSHGIEVTLGDEHLLGVMPELRVAYGGHRLWAAAEDVNEARRLLRTIEVADTGPQCQACGSRDLIPSRNRPEAFGPLLLFWLSGLVAPFAGRSAHLRCRACGHRQPRTDDEEPSDEP